MAMDQENVAAALAEYAMLVKERDALRVSINSRTELLIAMEALYEDLCTATVEAWTDFLQLSAVWALEQPLKCPNQ